MERLVTKTGNLPAVPTEIDMDFAFDLDRETFEGLQRIFNQLCAVTDILGDDYDLDRLRELVEADRDGRCVVFPCKVGDTVYLNDVVEYEIDDAGNNQYLTVSGTVTSITICDDKKIKIKCKESGNCIWILGETAFIAKEEAEAALRRMKGEGVH